MLEDAISHIYIYTYLFIIIPSLLRWYLHVHHPVFELGDWTRLSEQQQLSIRDCHMPNFPPLSLKLPHTIPYPKWHLQLKICRLPDLDRFGPNGWASLVLRYGERVWTRAMTNLPVGANAVNLCGESFEIWATRRSRKRLLWSLPPIQAIDHTWNPQNAAGSGVPFGCDLTKLLWCLRWASPKYRGWPCQQFSKVLPLH